jgi:hypothetical protein
LGQGDIRAQSFRSPGGGNPPIAAEEPCRCRHQVRLYSTRFVSMECVGDRDTDAK